MTKKIKKSKMNRRFVDGQILYFTATDGIHGYALWALKAPVTLYLPLILRGG